MEEISCADIGDITNYKELEFEPAWQSYWEQYGEYLVWEGWVNKYPEQIESGMYLGIPCIAEVEVESQEGEQVQVAAEETNHAKEDKTVSSVCGETENVGDKLEETGTNSIKDESSGGSPRSPSYVFPQSNKYQESYNSAIENIMRERTETLNNNSTDQSSSVTENIVNQQTETVNLMHSYFGLSQPMDGASGEGTHDGEENSEVENVIERPQGENTEQENYDIAWQELWNEHYTELYWYYYNQFLTEFNKLNVHSVQDTGYFENTIGSEERTEKDTVCEDYVINGGTQSDRDDEEVEDGSGKGRKRKGGSKNVQETGKQSASRTG